MILRKANKKVKYYYRKKTELTEIHFTYPPLLPDMYAIKTPLDRLDTRVVTFIKTISSRF